MTQDNLTELENIALSMRQITARISQMIELQQASKPGLINLKCFMGKNMEFLISKDNFIRLLNIELEMLEGKLLDLTQEYYSFKPNEKYGKPLKDKKGQEQK